MHISELMPKMAERMKHTCIIRALNTKNGDHGGAARLMHLGRRDEASLKYPDLGAVLARELGRADSQVPDYVTFYYGHRRARHRPRRSRLPRRPLRPMDLTERNMPPNLRRLEAITDLDHHERADLRELLSERFAHGRTVAVRSPAITKPTTASAA